jgi:hypothetical protein
LKLEVWAFTYAGAPRKVRAAMKSAISTYGQDKFGNKFAVDGTRHSGDQYTSCGNSFLHGSALTYGFAKCDSVATQPDGTSPLLSPVQIWNKHHLLFPILGDDNFIMGDAEFLDAAPLKQVMLTLGLELVPKKFTFAEHGSFAVHKATFCSSRFYPVEDTFVLGPCIGRVLSKAGYFVNIPKKIVPITLVRGDALGRIGACSFIPFLNKYWSRVISITKGQKSVLTSDMKRSLAYTPRPSKMFQPDASTYAMVEEVYGLTRIDEEAYSALLDNVTSLPWRGDFLPLHRAMVVDGICDDVLDIVPIPSPTPSLAPSPNVVSGPVTGPESKMDDETTIIRQNSACITIATHPSGIPAKYQPSKYLANLTYCRFCMKPPPLCECGHTVHKKVKTSFLDYL